MAHDESNSTDRRMFFQTGALATATALSLASDPEAPGAPVRPAALPRRTLGQTGAEITILEQGNVGSEGTDRILRLAFASGVRAFDTARVYGTEPNFRRWFEQAPDVRQQIFLVTKDMVRVPSQMMTMVDQRLATLGTDYIDLFFLHQLGDDHRLDEAIKLVKSPEFAQAVDAIKKAGKARFVGFSTHHRDRAPIIQAAAEGGIVDAIMLQYTPWLDKDSPLNKALDACWQRGIGLISMKQVGGHFYGDQNRDHILQDVVRRVPLLAEKKLTPYQGLLHAIWTDERISSCCVSMRNTDQLREDTDAARRFEPLKAAEIEQLRDAALAHGPMLCADCDGRCSVAAGTRAELGNLTRFLTYHQQHGRRGAVRRQYAALSPAARDWSGADLEAARAACPNRLDFARLLPEVERHLT